MDLRDDKMTRICLTCGKEFRLKRTYYIDKRPARYCSLTCTRTKSNINHQYFSPPLTPDKLITLGQFIATGFIQNDHTIFIRSNQETIDDIQSKIGTKYPVEKSDNGKLRLKITSSQMVKNLGDYGLVRNQLFQEFPPYDILQGLLKTDCYEEKEGVRLFRTPSSKLALEVSYLVGGEIITETFKDVFKGVLGCYWVVVW